MTRALLLASLLGIAGSASGQEPPADFQPIFSGPPGRVFLLSDFTHALGVVQRQDFAPTVPYALPGDEQLQGEATSILIEGDGVRMPLEQFSLPPEPAAVSRR